MEYAQRQEVNPLSEVSDQSEVLREDLNVSSDSEEEIDLDLSVKKNKVENTIKNRVPIRSNDKGNQENNSNLINVGKRKLATSKIQEKRARKKLHDGEEFERREMFRQINVREILDFDTRFFKMSEDKMLELIKPMCHSKRFWLAVRFLTSIDVGLSQNTICNIFGLNRQNIQKFLRKPDIKSISHDINAMMKIYLGLSPIETPKERYRHKKTILKYASNVEYVKRVLEMKY